MAQFALPNSLNYDEVLPSAPPSLQNLSQVVYPVNGSVFTQNQQIIVDIPSRGLIDPGSIYIRYQASVGYSNSGNITIAGCPIYAPFSRLDTMINSQIVDSVSDYNVVAHMWSNTSLGVSEKAGLQSSFGYLDATPATVSMDELDGRYLINATGAGGTDTWWMSGPLVCCKLSACDKMFPAFATGGIRLIFTIDTASNFFAYQATTTYTPASFSITNFELCYDLLDAGPEFERDVLSKPSIQIKSSGYNNSAVTIGAGTAGNQTFVFNQRFSSIRNAMLLPSGTSANAVQVNSKFDAVDVTTGGYYSLNIGGVTYPQAGPINFGTNRSGALSELRKSIGLLYDWSKSMSINNVEFSYTDNSTTSTTQPGKVYIAFDLNKLNSSSNLIMNGTSSQNSPINANIYFKTGVATGTTKQLYLILNYDCVFSIDPRTKMVTMIQ